MSEKLLGFTETPRFTKKILDLMPDEEFAELQLDLCDQPEIGDIIQGSGGIRKLRWAFAGKGKRGGARVIYYWAVKREKIFLLDIYAKNEKRDLTKDELKKLKNFVKESNK